MAKQGKEKVSQEQFVTTFIEVVGFDGTKGTYADVAEALDLAYGSVIQRANKYRKATSEGGFGINLPEPVRKPGGQRVDSEALNDLIAKMREAAEKPAE